MGRKREEKTFIHMYLKRHQSYLLHLALYLSPTHLVTYKPSLQSESPLPVPPITTFFFTTHKIFL